MKWLSFLAVLCALCLGCAEDAQGPKQPATPRVITLTPSLTEIVCAVGGESMLVGRSSACDYPATVKKVSVVGGFGRPSLEKVIALSPTVILETGLADQAFAEKLDSVCVGRERIKCTLVDDVPKAMRQVGELLGLSENAGKLADELEKEIAQHRARGAADENRPSVYVEIWHDPIMSVGNQSFISELVNLAGGRSIGDDVDKEYFKPSSEWAVSKNPDVILCLYMTDGQSVKDIVRSRPGWTSISAVKNGRIHDEFDHSVLLRPGPRLLEGVEALRKVIRGEK